MNPSLEKALHQSGCEILNSQLDPCCYASSMAEANGNSTLAMGIYVQKRAQDLLDKTQQAYQKDTYRLAAMQFSQPLRKKTKDPKTTGIAILLCFTLFLGTLSATMAIFAGAVGKINLQNLVQFVAIAAIGSACCITFAGWIFHLFPRLKFVKIMLFFTILAAGTSFLSGVKLVKSRTNIEWVS